jgi:hypothetical protein
MLQALNRSFEPQVIKAQDERPFTEWRQLYPDLWLLLEVTA